MKTFNEIVEIFESASAEEYLGEDITLVEHMIQTAELAREAHAPSWLVVAALLHDIGHILLPNAAEAQDGGIDLHHDEVGARWIAKRFPNNVVEAVRLHVDAKKYLVSTDQSYFDLLSEASKRTLEIQGGIFSKEEAEQFINRKFAREAILLRLWDDAGKIRGLSISTIYNFKEDLILVALS